MDMRFYWICDRVDQNKLFIYYKLGSHNLGDYTTKNFPSNHHVAMSPTYLHVPPVKNISPFLAEKSTQSALQGCVK